MAIPKLRLRKDIWAHFPVNVDSMGRGANGADRHCIEWHNLKVRDMAKQQGKTAEELKDMLFPQLFAALSASSAWTVEAPPPGSKCIAVIAMKFDGATARPANATRRNQKPRTPPAATKANGKNNGRNVRTWRRSRTPTPPPAAAPKSKTRTPKTPRSKSKSPNKPAATATRRNYSKLEGEALLKKAKGIINLMSDTTINKLSEEFATLHPKTIGDYEALMKNVFEQALESQMYHPLIVHLLHVMNAKHEKIPYPGKPSESIVQRTLERAMEEPIYVKMEIEAEDIEVANPLNFEDKVNHEKSYMRSCMLLAGFLFREGFMEWKQLYPLLAHLRAVVFETDPNELDYRMYDATTQCLLYVLIRGGQRMVMEGGDAAAFFEDVKPKIASLMTTARRGYIRSAATDFIEAVDGGFMIKEGMPWTIGAPKTDVKVRPAAVAATRQAQAPAAGLGEDIGELWRRFPLDVKQDGPLYLVKFHRKKLADRLAKETRFKSAADLEAALTKQVMGLIDASKHWKRGPAVGDAGVFVSIVKK